MKSILGCSTQCHHVLQAFRFRNMSGFMQKYCRVKELWPVNDQIKNILKTGSVTF